MFIVQHKRANNWDYNQFKVLVCPKIEILSSFSNAVMGNGALNLQKLSETHN